MTARQGELRQRKLASQDDILSLPLLQDRAGLTAESIHRNPRILR